MAAPAAHGCELTRSFNYEVKVNDEASGTIGVCAKGQFTGTFNRQTFAGPCVLRNGAAAEESDGVSRVKFDLFPGGRVSQFPVATLHGIVTAIGVDDSRVVITEADARACRGAPPATFDAASQQMSVYMPRK